MFFLILFPFFSSGQVTLPPDGMFYMSSDLGPYFSDEVPKYSNKTMYVSSNQDIGPAAIFQTMGRRVQGSGSRYSDRNAWYSAMYRLPMDDGAFTFVPNRSDEGRPVTVFQYVTFSGRKPNDHTSTPLWNFGYNSFTILVETPEFVGVDQFEEISEGPNFVPISVFFKSSIKEVIFTLDGVTTTIIDLQSLSVGNHVIKAIKEYNNGTYTGELRFSVSRQGINEATATAKISREKNFVLTRVFKQPNVNADNIGNIRPVEDESQSIEYLDGLGRSIQTVSVMASPGKNDLIRPIDYDPFGRENIKYQSYSAKSNGGTYRVNTITEQLGFYASQTGIKTTSTPFSVSIFEPSPLNRIEQQGAPGEDWQPSSNHAVRMDYGTNIEHEVRFWNENNNGATGITYYPAGKLYKTIIKDENWVEGHENTTEEFKDFQGRIVLKRSWSDNSTSLSTYYVYDDLGSLRYILPPGVNENGKNIVTSFDETLPAFYNFIYGFHYDDSKRLIEKKIPGKGWDYMVYNKLDQVVLTQDANQKQKQQWSFIKYDAFGRVVITGLYHDIRVQSQLQSDLVNESVLYERRELGADYKNTSFPQSEIDILTINYYDDYRFPDNNFGEPKESQASGERIKGLLTGTKIKNLGTGIMALKVNYYDLEGRILQTKANNHLGGTDQVDNNYNFAGELIASNHIHIANGLTTTIDNIYTYDHAGRKISTKENINKQGEIVLNMLEYNEIGQLKGRKIHGLNVGQQSLLQDIVLNVTDIVKSGKSSIVTASKSITLSAGFIAEEGSSFEANIIDDTFLQSTLFTYNERGWLNNAESDKFKEELKYTNKDLLDVPNAPQANYNGNISVQRYNGEHSGMQYFKYGYDKLNRLTNSVHSNGTLLNEMMTYDVMGNITRLERGGNSNPIIYNYQNANQSNVLESVSGGLNRNYIYDVNGNLYKDGTGGGANTWSYNHLNLPVSITGDITVNYTYNAIGEKLKSTGSGINRDYVNGIHYENGVLKFIATETGRAVRIGNTQNYRYEHNLSDHLGNVRVTIDDQGHNVARVVQENEYYAFGLVKPGGYLFGDKNNYLYNGKELQEELGQYDYGARFYDPVIGRWNVIDPLAEKSRRFSPYVYGNNNPIRFIDPDGMEAMSPIYGRNGDFLGTDDEGITGQAIVMKKEDFSQGMSHEEAKSKSTYKEGDSNFGFADEKGALKYANHYVNLKNRPDYDGKLTLGEANEWYRTGGGKPLFVDASKIDLAPVYQGDLSAGDSKYVNFASPGNANFETGLVYGTIKLTLIGGNKVKLGGNNSVLDTYDFDYQKGRTGRNVATWMGKIVAGEGTGYTLAKGSVSGNGAINLDYGDANTFEQRVSANKNFGAKQGMTKGPTGLPVVLHFPRR